MRRPAPIADPTERPSTVVTAWWLAVATAVASFLLNGLGLVTSGGQLDALRSDAAGRGASAAQVQPVIVVAVVLVAAVTVAYSVLLVLFARRMRAGRPSARVVTTVLCAISLVAIVGFTVNAVQGLIAAFAIVFAWLPASSDWFRGARRPV